MVQRQCRNLIRPCRAFVPAMLLALLLPLTAAADDAQTLLNSAQAAYDAGEYDQAQGLYQQVIDKFPDKSHAGYALVGLATIHLRNHDNGQTLAKLDQVLSGYARPQLLGRAAMFKLSLLANRLNDYAGGIEFGEAWLADNGDLMNNYDRALMVIYITYCYDKSGQRDDAVAVFKQEIINSPALFIYPLYYQRLLEVQLGTGDLNGALTTARVGYALCEFDQTSIEAMSNLVRKAYASRGEILKATQFFAAQEVPERNNPLLDVALPKVSDKQLEAMLAACGGDSRLKVCAYLYAGNYREAMTEAQLHMAVAPAAQMVQALGQVARVFKAKDLNLIRGNRFLDYARTGEGENPLPAFWDEVTD